MTRKIHPTAIVDPAAKLGDGAEIGPFSVIGPDVEIGAGTRLAERVSILGWTHIGEECEIHPGAVIGGKPQDLKFKGDRSDVIVGDRTVIRECVTIHRATFEGEETRVGGGCLLMAYSHVAHNCVVGNGVILGNSVALAGHVAIEDEAVVGGLTGIHQFVRVGYRAYVGGMAAVRLDIVPFTLSGGHPCRLLGLNVIGLRRKGYSQEEIDDLQKAYRILFREGLTENQAIERLRECFPGSGDVGRFVGFASNSERGLTRPLGGAASAE
jgi:UDP-N-acetylglucosamine acyltransferase